MSLFPLIQSVQQSVQSWAGQAQQQVQQQARRNAMLALTECTQRRAEREEVAAFFAERAAEPAVTRDTTVSLHA